jgi:hypothetical protein
MSNIDTQQTPTYPPPGPEKKGRGPGFWLASIFGALLLFALVAIFSDDPAADEREEEIAEVTRSAQERREETLAQQREDREDREAEEARASEREAEREAWAEERRQAAEDRRSQPEPAAYGTYGSDPALDRLQDRCADGDMSACDTLFTDSPLDSEYEDFGDSCGGRQAIGTGAWCAEGGPGLSDELVEGIHRLAMEMTWSSMSPMEQLELCRGFELLGYDLSYRAWEDGWGDDVPSQAEFEAFFTEVCS